MLRQPSCIFSYLFNYEACSFDCHFTTIFAIGLNKGVPRDCVDMLFNYKISCVYI